MRRQRVSVWKRLRYWVSLLYAIRQLKRVEKLYRKMQSRVAADENHYSLQPGGNGVVMDEGRALRATTCLVLPNGAGFPFCRIEHLAAYCLAAGKKQHDFVIGQSSAKAAYCSHCYWCGRIIRSPHRCVIHYDDASCPKFRFSVTRNAGLIIQEFVGLYNRTPNDSELQTMENIYLRNAHLTPFEVVRVLDVEDDDGLPEVDQSEWDGSELDDE